MPPKRKPEGYATCSSDDKIQCKTLNARKRLRAQEQMNRMAYLRGEGVDAMLTQQQQPKPTNKQRREVRRMKEMDIGRVREARLWTYQPENTRTRTFAGRVMSSIGCGERERIAVRFVLWCRTRTGDSGERDCTDVANANVR